MYTYLEFLFPLRGASAARQAWHKLILREFEITKTFVTPCTSTVYTTKYKIILDLD